MKVNHVIPILVVTLASLLLGTEAKKYRVGGDLGWTIPPSGAASYASGVSKYTFKVNRDLLGFDFNPGENDVIIVMRENLDICNTKPLYQYKGPVALAVANPGIYNFNCSSAGHCAKAQKAAIHFAPSSNLLHSASPSPSPSPSSSASDESPAAEHQCITK